MIVLPSTGPAVNNTPASSFVPAGKIRHQVFSDTQYIAATGATTTTTREVWITNGKTHLLVREDKDQKGDYMLLGENTVWSYNPSLVPTLVYTYQYTPKQLKFYAPDRQVATEMQQEIGAHVVGTTTVEDRIALLIERSYNIAPGSPMDPSSGGVLLYRFWIDTSSDELVREEHDIRESENGLYTNNIDTFVSTMTTDELLDAKNVPADLFVFVQPPNTFVIHDPSVYFGP